VPSIERNLLEIQREQGIKEALYSYLLQKREESAISLASTVSNTRIIDKALAGDRPVKPKKIIVLFIALFLGSITPISVLYIRDLLNEKVTLMSDVQEFIPVPILGELIHNEDEEHTLVVQKSSRTPLAELFRLIRTNLQFA